MKKLIGICLLIGLLVFSISLFDFESGDTKPKSDFTNNTEVGYQQLLNGAIPVEYNTGENVEGLESVTFIGIKAGKAVLLIDGSTRFLAMFPLVAVHEIQGETIVIREKGTNTAEITVLEK